MRNAIILLIFFATFSTQASELEGILRNNEGVKRFENKKTVEAYEKFTESLIDLPFDPKVHLNLGDTFLEHKEFDKALQEFETAARLAEKDPNTKFKALFNSGVAATLKKDVDLALNYYQRSLELDPTSKEAKTNIELLIQGGGGGGGGDQDQDQENQDQKDGEGNQDQQKQDPKQGRGKKQKPKPKPFNSQDVTEQNVNRILEELKRQEEEIRAKMQREGAKDVPRGKDW